MSILNKNNKTRTLGVLDVYGGIAFSATGISLGGSQVSKLISERIRTKNLSIDELYDKDIMGEIFKKYHVRKISSKVRIETIYKDQSFLALNYFVKARSGVVFKLGTLVASTPDVVDELEERMSYVRWGNNDLRDFIAHIIRLKNSH